MTKHNRRLATKRSAAVVTMGLVGLFGTGTASATHTHSMQTGRGSCVLLAQNGGEDGVVLPFVTGDATGTRSHPIHVLVHTGEPGDGGHITIGVQGAGSDPCPGDYLNG